MLTSKSLVRVGLGAILKFYSELLELEDFLSLLENDGLNSLHELVLILQTLRQHIVLGFQLAAELFEDLHLHLELLSVLDADRGVLLRLLLEGFELRPSDLIFRLEWILRVSIIEGHFLHLFINFLDVQLFVRASWSELRRQLVNELTGGVADT